MQDHKERAPALRATNAVPLLIVLVVLAVAGVAAVDPFGPSPGSAPTGGAVHVERVDADARLVPSSCETLAVRISGRAENGPGAVRYRLDVTGATTRTRASGEIRVGEDGRFDRVETVRVDPGDARLRVRVSASGAGSTPVEASAEALARTPARCRSLGGAP